MSAAKFYPIKQNLVFLYLILVTELGIVFQILDRCNWVFFGVMCTYEIILFISVENKKKKEKKKGN